MRRKQESFGEQNVSLTRLEYQVNYRAVIQEQRETSPDKKQICILS